VVHTSNSHTMFAITPKPFSSSYAFCCVPEDDLTDSLWQTRTI